MVSWYLPKIKILKLLNRRYDYIVYTLLKILIYILYSHKIFLTYTIQKIELLSLITIYKLILY